MARAHKIVDYLLTPGNPSGTPTRKPSCPRPKEKPSISIVIPAFNEAAYIARTLESLSAAALYYGTEVETIVVDNNSTDATAEIARSLGASVVYEPINQIARARNAGARTASGDCLVFLDADTTIEGDILDKVAARLSSGRVIGGGAWAEPDSDWLGRLVFKYLINMALAVRNVTVGPFLYCDRLAFQKVGGFEESLYAAEEISLARRLKREGRKDQRQWKIIKYDKQHRVITSARKFRRFRGLEMAVQNAHLVWKPNQKLRQKSQCRFWYDARKRG